MLRHRTRAAGTAALMLTLAATIPAVAAGGVVDEITAYDAATGAALRPSQSLVERPSTARLPLPADPQRALIDAAGGLSAELGFPQYTSSRVRAAGLSDALAGRLANAARAARACAAVSRAHFSQIGERIGEVLRDGGGLDPAQLTDIRDCAEPLWKAINDLRLGLTSGELRAPAAPLDLWPVLKVAGAGDDVHANDYVLLLDTGGDDTYTSNAGASVVDLHFAPPGSPVPGLRGYGPSRGCQAGTPDAENLLNGRCTFAAGALLDLRGNDTYGVKQAPDLDARCTAQPLVRRIVTAGAGLLGVGILQDAEGDDAYTGKTFSLGAGHAFGVGILSDLAGNDAYAAVRNSQGASSVNGYLGVLRDEGGNDSYDWYMPAPLDPNAANETDGAGGVLDDVGACDNRRRFLQGSGNLGGVGVLIEDGGADSYRGAFSTDGLQPLIGPVPGGSQGYGTNGGAGVLYDRAGSDAYRIVGDQGAPARGDAVTVTPDPQCRRSTCTGGLFVDRSGQ